MEKEEQKEKLVCSKCGTDDLTVTLANGEKLPSYRYNISTGLVTCNTCGKGHR